MTVGEWVLVVAVLTALAFGAWRAWTDGRFRGTHAVRGGGVETGAGRPGPQVEEVALQPSRNQGAGSVSVLEGSSYDAQRGERVTLLQFSSAFCAPCRATRRVLGEVAAVVPGAVHLEIDAEQHLDLVRRLGVLRTPTTLVLDAAGREVTRAAGTPRKEQVLAALAAGERA